MASRPFYGSDCCQFPPKFSHDEAKLDPVRLWHSGLVSARGNVGEGREEVAQSSYGCSLGGGIVLVSLSLDCAVARPCDFPGGCSGTPSPNFLLGRLGDLCN